MKITGILVDILIKMAPHIYADYVCYENGKAVIYVVVLMAIYGMLISALLWYKKFKSDLETIGFVFNDYDMCIANCMVNGKQQTIKFHVDDFMSSHEDSKVNNDLFKWMNDIYGKHGKIVVTRGNTHKYLGMTFVYEKKKLKTDMREYVKKMLEE